MKVALFGGTGFVGTYITEELLNNNHDPVLLVRPGSENKVYLPDKCHVNVGYITDFESIEQTINNTDAVIYNIGIIRQFPKKGIIDQIFSRTIPKKYRTGMDYISSIFNIW